MVATEIGIVREETEAGVALRVALPEALTQAAPDRVARLVWFHLEEALRTELSGGASPPLRITLEPRAGAMEEAVSGRLLAALGDALRRSGIAERCAALSLGVAGWSAGAARPGGHRIDAPVARHRAILEMAGPLREALGGLAQGRDPVDAVIAGALAEAEAGDGLDASVLALGLWLGEALEARGFRWATVTDARGEALALVRPVPGSRTARQVVHPFAVIEKRLRRGETFDPRALVDRIDRGV